MDGIERIEVAVKTCLTQIFSLVHGPFGHLDRQNLPNLQPHEHQRLISKLRRDQRHSREKFVDSYQTKYTSETDLPLWMAIELMDFGSIFTLYRGLPRRLAKAVAREFKLSAPVLESWLQSLNYLRNLCAHHARLLNRNLSVPPMLPQQRTHPEFYQPVPVPVSKVFTALTIQKYLLDQIAPQSHWAKRLLALWDEKHPNISPHLLGFPPNWQSTPIWENTRPRWKVRKRLRCRPSVPSHPQPVSLIMNDPNEQREGYKFTKVGWIPQDWKCERLEDISSVQTGIAKNKSSGNGLKDVPYLRVANVQDGYVDLSCVKKIGISEEKMERYLLKKGDVLFTEGGDFDKLGRGTVWQEEITPCAHQNHVFAVRCNPNTLKPTILAAWASDWRGRRYFQLCSKQSTNLASINSSQLKAFPVPLPPLPEQEKIATILSTWDDGLEQLDSLIKAKTRQKTALMQQLLTGKTRLPGFDGEWKNKRLGQIFSERAETKRPDLELLAISGSRGILPASLLNRKDSSNADKSKYKRICPGDIGYNTMRMWQGVSSISSYEGIVSPAYTICIPSPKHDVRYLAFLFKLPSMVNIFWRHSQGLVADTLGLKFPSFAKIKVSLPTLEEQTAIAEILTTAETELTHLKAKQSALQQQKKSLMQKLLTGQVRVTL